MLLNTKPSDTLRLIVARSPAERALAYQLRYLAYSFYGHIEENSERSFSDEYDLEENCLTFLVLDGDSAVGSIRICVFDSTNNWKKVPILSPFGKEISNCLSPTSCWCECNRLVVHPECTLNRLRIKHYLLAVPLIVSDHYPIEAFVCGVREGEGGFYRRLGYRQKTEPRPYPLLRFSTVLMVSEFNEQVARNLPTALNEPRKLADLHHEMMLGVLHN